VTGRKSDIPKLRHRKDPTIIARDPKLTDLTTENDLKSVSDRNIRIVPITEKDLKIPTITSKSRLA
jgi:hypothetical protein